MEKETTHYFINREHLEEVKQSIPKRQEQIFSVHREIFADFYDDKRLENLNLLTRLKQTGLSNSGAAFNKWFVQNEPFSESEQQIISEDEQRHILYDLKLFKKIQNVWAHFSQDVEQILAKESPTSMIEINPELARNIHYYFSEISKKMTPRKIQEGVQMPLDFSRNLEDSRNLRAPTIESVTQPDLKTPQAKL